MSGALPSVFIALAGLSLCIVLYAMWQSLRMLVGAGEATGDAATLSPAEREALLSQKNELLTAIRDVKFEHDLGKISPRDYERLDRRYRGKAREVLRELDEQLSPYRARAQQLLAEAMGAAPAADADAQAPQGDAQPATDLACPKCEQINDADAVFCKKCAHRLVAEDA